MRLLKHLYRKSYSSSILFRVRVCVCYEDLQRRAKLRRNKRLDALNRHFYRPLIVSANVSFVSVKLSDVLVILSHRCLSVHVGFSYLLVPGFHCVLVCELFTNRMEIYQFIQISRVHLFSGHKLIKAGQNKSIIEQSEFQDCAFRNYFCLALSKWTFICCKIALGNPM